MADDTSDWNQEPQVIADVATGVRCRIDESRGRQVTLPGDQGTVVVDAVGFFRAGVDLTEDDQVVVNGRTYEVALTRDAAGQGHHVEADLRLVRQPTVAT